MDGGKIRGASGGVNQSGVRNHNERLLLSMLQRRGGMAGIDLARLTGLSPQTVSVIFRKLEQDGFLRRGDPVRGKVGKPSIPMELSPDGVLSLGLKIGRRSAELLLLDFTGNVRAQVSTGYPYPLPDEVFTFLEEGMASLLADLSEDAAGSGLRHRHRRTVRVVEVERPDRCTVTAVQIVEGSGFRGTGGALHGPAGLRGERRHCGLSCRTPLRAHARLPRLGVFLHRFFCRRRRCRQ